MKKPSTNVQEVEILLLKELIMFRNKDKNTVIDVPICIKHQSTARNRDLDFTDARYFFIS